MGKCLVSGEREKRKAHDRGVKTLNQLFRHCADLGIEVEWADLGSTKHGEYRATTDTITLSARLTHRQALAALAHEIGHREFGDRCSTPAIERRAWEYAAAFLITPPDYAAAENAVGSHMGALASELEVTPKVIEAWRRWWHKRGHLLEGGDHISWDDRLTGWGGRE